MKLIISMIVTFVAAGCSNSNEIQTLKDENVQLRAKLKSLELSRDKSVKILHGFTVENKKNIQILIAKSDALEFGWRRIALDVRALKAEIKKPKE